MIDRRTVILGAAGLAAVKTAESATPTERVLGMDAKYLGQKEQAWMVNFRVRSLDAMVAQLRKADIEVKVDPQKYPNGRFARLHDPEGNPIELWEPATPAHGGYPSGS